MISEEQQGAALAAIVRGMVVALLGSIVGGGFGFAYLIVMARMLDQVGFGLFVLALNLLTLGSALGIAGADYAAIRFVAAADSPGRKRGAMATPIVMTFLFNCAIGGLLALVAHPVAVHVLGEPKMTTPLRLVGLVLPLTVTADMLSAAVSGLELASGELIRKVTEQGGRILFSSFLVAVGLGVGGAVAGMAVAGAFATVAVGLVLLRHIPRGGKLEWLPPRAVVAFAWPQTLANVAAQLWVTVAVVALAHFSGTRAVALWGAATAIARLPALVYNAFTYRFSPTIARLWEQQDLAELARLLRSVTRWVTMLAVPLYAVAIALPHPLLRLYGSHYGGGATVLVLVAIAVMFDSLAGPNDRALIMTGRVRLEMAANVTTAVVMTGVAVLLTAEFGLTGAAVGLLTYNVLVNVLKSLLVQRTLGMNSLSLGMLGPIVAAAVAGAIAIGVQHALGLGSSAPGAVLLAAVLVAAYVVVLLFVVGISPEDRSALRLAVRPSQ